MHYSVNDYELYAYNYVCIFIVQILMSVTTASHVIMYVPTLLEVLSVVVKVDTLWKEIFALVSPYSW